MMYFLLIVLIIIVIYFLLKKTQKKEIIKNPYLPDKFIVADVETTGLNYLTDSIIEISAIKVDPNSNNHITFHSLINPNIKIPKKIEKLTGINNAMVENGDSIEIGIEDFLNFVEQLPIVFYNAPFDIGFLTKAAEKVSRKINNEVIDALPMCRIAFPDLPEYKLTTVANNFNIKTDGSHRALKDCELTMYVYNFASFKLKKRSVDKKGNNFSEFADKKIDSKLLKPNLDVANKENPFYNKKVVFTGNLQAIDRKDAAIKIQKLGAYINIAISKKTKIVIVGNEAGPSKMKKIEELNAQGCDIRLIYEEEFLSLIK